MKRSPHPLLDRLFAQGATPALLLERWQATERSLQGIDDALRRVGLDAEDPWSSLLAVPFAAPGSGGALQSLLDHLAMPADSAAAAAARTPSMREPSALQPAATRGSAASGPQYGARATVSPLRNAVAFAAAMSAMSPPPRAPFAVIEGRRQPDGEWKRPLSARTATPTTMPPVIVPAITARVAAATWLQRAAAAGVHVAFSTPVGAAGRARVDAAALPDTHPPRPTVGRPQRHSATPRTGAAGVSPPAAHAGAAEQSPVRLRLGAVLERIERGSPRMAFPPPGFKARAPEAGHTASLAASGPPSFPPPTAGEQPPGGFRADPAGIDANDVAHTRVTSPAGALGGLRGLAARAATGLSPPAPVPSLWRTSAPREILPTASDAAGGDDERIVEQLARLLRREAERDGIDVSDAAS